MNPNQPYDPSAQTPPQNPGTNPITPSSPQTSPYSTPPTNNPSIQSPDSSGYPQSPLVVSPTYPVGISETGYAAGSVPPVATSAPPVQTAGTPPYPSSATLGQPEAMPYTSPALAPNTYALQAEAATVSTAGRRTVKKKLLIGAVIAIVLLALPLGYVFGFYIPNKPENVWRTGLNRTGEALSTLAGTALDEEQVKKIVANSYEMTADVKTESGNFSGDFAIEADKTNLKSSSKLKYSIKEAENGDGQINIDYLGTTPKNALIPTTYFQVSGVDPKLVDQLLPGGGQYLNKWVRIDENDIKELAPEYTDMIAGSNKDQVDKIEAQDITNLLKDITKHTSEHLFSTEPSKAVLNLKSVVGKEKDNNRDTIHYKASINAENAEKYCRAVATTFFDSNVFKKISESGSAATSKPSESQIADDCKKIVADEAERRDTYDIWIDTKYKLIGKIRIYESKSSTSSYVDVGQYYTGGDEIKLYTHVVDEEEKNDLRIDITTNVKTYQTTLEGKLSVGTSAIDASMRMTIKQLQNPVKLDIPDNTVPFKQIIEQISNQTTTSPSYQLEDDSLFSSSTPSTRS